MINHKLLRSARLSMTNLLVLLLESVSLMTAEVARTLLMIHHLLAQSNAKAMMISVLITTVHQYQESASKT